MKVLVACEYSGTVRDAFISMGHEAMSCDLLPTDVPGPHYQGDVFDIINQGWDMMIAHPPCTYLCVSGLHWNKRVEGRDAKTDEALEFVKRLLDAPIQRIALENPVGCISKRIRKPEQIIQPYEYGDDAAKKTCLWLKNLPKLRPTDRVRGCKVKTPSGKIVERWSNQCDNYGQDKTPPSPDRWKIRSKTWQGIADAMASQWGIL
ncbi:DNA cytosine methyltransferase [bacterium]|nr:DNA cytosine methyltransferase [bacterium]